MSAQPILLLWIAPNLPSPTPSLKSGYISTVVRLINGFLCIPDLFKAFSTTTLQRHHCILPCCVFDGHFQALRARLAENLTDRCHGIFATSAPFRLAPGWLFPVLLRRLSFSGDGLMHFYLFSSVGHPPSLLLAFDVTSSVLPLVTQHVELMLHFPVG